MFHCRIKNLNSKKGIMKKFLFTLLAAGTLSFGVNAQSIADIVADSPDHNTLEAALNAAELTSVLDGTDEFTLFAPTDAAFANLPEGLVEALLTDPSGVLTEVLLYHVVSGAAPSSALSDGQMVATVNGQDVTVSIADGNVMINSAMVTVADIMADNGIVHVVDAVLVPTTTTIYDVVTQSPDHTTLETAIDLAGLDGTLSGPGTFTLFAPTDAAFAAVDPATLNALLADPQGLLTDVLLYHAVGSIALSSNLSDGASVPTLFGENVTVTIDGSTVMINEAMVTVADIVTINGIVHVIDAVLVPTTLSVDDISALNSLEVYPNPAIDKFKVVLDMEQSERVTIDVLDITGKTVFTENLGQLSAGQNTQTLDVSDLDAGIYLVNITIGNNQATTKLQVSK